MLVQIASCFTLKSRGEIIFSFIICNRQNRPDRICAQILVYCRWACRQISGRSVQYSTSWPVMKLLWETFVDCKPTRTRKTPRADNVSWQFYLFSFEKHFLSQQPEAEQKTKKMIFWILILTFSLFVLVKFWSKNDRTSGKPVTLLKPDWKKDVVYLVQFPIAPSVKKALFVACSNNV